MFKKSSLLLIIQVATAEKRVADNYLRLCAQPNLINCTDILIDPSTYSAENSMDISVKSYEDDSLSWISDFRKGNIRSFAVGAHVRAKLCFDWCDEDTWGFDY
jgi:hypothetical protein